MKKMAAAAAIALGVVLANATGVAHADDVTVRDENGVPLSWTNKAACEAAGPNEHLTNDAEERALRFWHCELHADGVWYLHNTDTSVPEVP